MSPTSESKRNNRKGKKKRVLQTKENQPPKTTDTSVKSDIMTKPSLDSSVPLSQVVNKAHFTPLLDGERCILCHQERPVISRKGGSDIENPLGEQVIDKLPLWVCPECRKKVEEDEQRAGIEKTDSTDSGVINSLLSDDVQEKDTCNCYVCAGQRHLVPGKSKELQELQFSWFEVKHFVRCAYREAGTALAADDKLRSSSPDMERIKRDTERLTLKDPHQLYERLEAQAHEYLGEVREDLTKFLSTPFTNPLQHSKDCAATILDEYQSLIVALNIVKPFMVKLESSYLKKFDMTWELLNKNVFYEEIFDDPIIQSSFPILIIQLRSSKPLSSLNMPIPDEPLDEAQANLLARYKQISQISRETRRADVMEKLVEHITDISNIDCNHSSSSTIRRRPLYLWNRAKTRNPELPTSVIQFGTSLLRFESFNQEMIAIKKLAKEVQFLKEKYINEKNGTERWKTSENWEDFTEDDTETTEKEFYSCENCVTPSSPILSGSQLSDISSSLSSPKHVCSSTSSSTTATYCARHSHNGDHSNLSSSQLIPTALFLNRFTNSKCASCIREALHSFCFDQNMTTKCQHHAEEEEKDNLSLLSDPYPIPPCQGCETHEVQHGCPFQHTARSPETASSIQSLLLSGSSTEKCRHEHCKHHHSDKTSEWEDDEGGTGEDGQEHRGATSPSIIIPGNNVNLEAPPSSPSSVRSNGDGSSCDTPTSRSSLSEDGRPNNGKYCDCCYCEFFGHGTPPAAQTSHNFVEMREKLRLRLKEKEKEKKHVDYPEHHRREHDCLTDDRSVDELLTFINGEKTDDTAAETHRMKISSKAAKRHRQKMKKAAEKGSHVIESDIQGYYRLRSDNEKDQRQSNCLEKTRKCLKQKKSGKTQALVETQEQNTKNSAKSCLKQPGQSASREEHKNCDEKPARPPANGPENAGNVDKRRKRKEKHYAPNESRYSDSAKGQERRVIVNGNGDEASRYVEHTRGARLPVREEAEPRHCGEERPAKEVQSETQGKKSKGRRKKKNASLDDVFLPKENDENGHSGEVDEAEREVEEFKRFCLSVAPASRKLKLPATVNLKNLNLGSKKS